MDYRIKEEKRMIYNDDNEVAHTNAFTGGETMSVSAYLQLNRSNLICLIHANSTFTILPSNVGLCCLVAVLSYTVTSYCS